MNFNVFSDRFSIPRKPSIDVIIGIFSPAYLGTLLSLFNFKLSEDAKKKTGNPERRCERIAINHRVIS